MDREENKILSLSTVIIIADDLSGLAGSGS